MPYFFLLFYFESFRKLTTAYNSQSLKTAIARLLKVDCKPKISLHTQKLQQHRSKDDD